MRTGDLNSPTNGLSNTRTPLSPSSRSCHVFSASGASEVVDATAVTTTSANPSPVLNGAMLPFLHLLADRVEVPATTVRVFRECRQPFPWQESLNKGWRINPT